VGIILKSTGIAARTHGEFMLRSVLTVTLPLLILSTLSMTPMTLNKAMLPVANIAVSFACVLITLLVIKMFTVERKQAGTGVAQTSACLLLRWQFHRG
jgi:predicted permease